jgi:hypothetical protein
MICPECNEPKLRKVYQPWGSSLRAAALFDRPPLTFGQTYTHPKEETAGAAKSEPAKTAKKARLGGGSNSNGSNAGD